MSFILDALKKSETERQRQKVPGFADVPDGTDSPRASRWLWVLGGLLAINVVFLSGLVLRQELQPTTAPTAPVETIPVVEPADATLSAIVEEARQVEPQQTADTAGETTFDAKPVVEGRTTSMTRMPRKITAPLSTFNELRANGTILLEDLHLDIHVYSEQPEKRFVFVNMNKYREHARLAEGPLVREITPEGVILEHLGNGFLLPRD